MSIGGYSPAQADVARAERDHASVWEAVVDGATGKVLSRRPLPGLSGSIAKCHDFIARLQAQHEVSGYNAEFSYWFGRDTPERGLKATRVVRWHLE